MSIGYRVDSQSLSVDLFDAANPAVILATVTEASVVEHAGIVPEDVRGVAGMVYAALQSNPTADLTQFLTEVVGQADVQPVEITATDEATATDQTPVENSAAVVQTGLNG